MKQLTLLIILLFLGITSCTESPSECNAFCDSEELGDFFKNHGDCVSFCATCSNLSETDNKVAICYCNYIEVELNASNQDWDDIGIKNKGQCVKLLLNEIKSID